MMSAIVLAAGLSTRMGGVNKLLLPFKGKTVIVTVVEHLVNAGIEEIIVVTGNHAEQVKNLLKHLDVKVIYNEDFKKGMTSSIKKGVLGVKGNSYMICLGDMPFITNEEYLQIRTFFEKQRHLNDACICIPTYKNKKGNPVVFSSFFKSEIFKHTNMEGCKGIIAGNQQNVYKLEMKAANILKDIDTADNYSKAVM